MLAPASEPQWQQALQERSACLSLQARQGTLSPFFFHFLLLAAATHLCIHCGQPLAGCLIYE